MFCQEFAEGGPIGMMGQLSQRIQDAESWAVGRAIQHAGIGMA